MSGSMWSRRVCVVVAVVAWVPGDGSLASPVGTNPCHDLICEKQGTAGDSQASQLPRITVGLKVVKQNETIPEVAVLTINKGLTSGNRTLSWDSESLLSQNHFLQSDQNSSASHSVPPASGETPDSAPTFLPLPIVTVSSRLLFAGVQRDEDEEKSPSSQARDPLLRTLQFEPVPEGEPYLTDVTHAKPTVLAWAGAVISALHPTHFPFELVRAAVEHRITPLQLLIQSLQAEPLLAACLGVCGALATGMPLVGLLVCCCRLAGRCGASKTQHGRAECFHCRRRMLTVALSFISCAVLSGLVVVVVSNQRLGDALSQARHSINSNLRDLNTFLANTKMQLRFLVTDSLEQTVHAINTDLDDIEYLLGRPLQRELAGEAQIEAALDSLLHISSSFREIAGRMRSLENTRVLAAARSEELRDRLVELSADIQRFVSRCSVEDADLCNSLDHRGLDLAARFDSFSFSEQLRLLSVVERHNLTEMARQARYEFDNIPSFVKVVTRTTRDDAKRVMRAFRGGLYSKVNSLDDVAFDFEVRTKDLSWRVDEATAALLVHDHYRWYTGLGITVCLGLVWAVMTVGVCCGCCVHAQDQAPTDRSCVSNSAGQTFISSVFLIFVLSGLLWAVVAVVFVVAGHAHAFICRPLYDQPDFPILTQLLNHSEVLLGQGPLLASVLHPGRDIHLNIGQVLRRCKEGGAAYQVFQLRHYFDVERELDPHTTLDLRQTLANLRINLSQIEFLSLEAETHLNDFLRSVKIDLEPFRKEMEKPLVQKSLPALSDQMQNVAGQLRSVSASAELFRMVARTRNLITNTLYPLEKRKEEVSYQVATLDMEAMPLQRQINQSAGHLRTIQYFLHSHGSSLAAAKVRDYVERLLGYARQYTDHVRTSALHHVAPCTPVWNLFDSARGIACNGIIVPVNALWLATSWCLLLFLPSVCLSLALSRYYLRLHHHHDDALPLESNGSPPESATNVPSGSSAAMWASKHSVPADRAPQYSLPSHRQNGDEVNEESDRNIVGERADIPLRRQRISRPSHAVEEALAGAQVVAWRDAWRAGGSFITLDMVARHVQRSLSWVRRHWNVNLDSIAISLSARADQRYPEQTPNTPHYSVYGNCCGKSDFL
nr:prominin-1-A-like isoform X1 [Procambarus clarkii]